MSDVDTSEQVIAALRDQYTRDVIEVEDFELAVEQALWEQETTPTGNPEPDLWVQLALERLAKEHTTI